MSLIAARAALIGGGKKLPYDAEVEYIETDGVGSFIDTNIVPVLVADNDYSVVTVDFAL